MSISVYNNPHRDREIDPQDLQQFRNCLNGASDPLTAEQKLKIKRFFDYFLLSSEKEEVIGFYGKKTGKIDYLRKCKLYGQEIKLLFNNNLNNNQKEKLKKICSEMGNHQNKWRKNSSFFKTSLITRHLMANF